jgi:hypothetical protein
MMHRLFLLASLLALVVAEDAPSVDSSPASPSQPEPQAGASKRSSRRSRKRGRACRIPGCSRCSAVDRNTCEVCKMGYHMNEYSKCARCAAGCKDCRSATTCERCADGFTVDPSTKQCASCAAHCLKCDEAGPGGCNECGPRRMLEVRLEVHGEVHECHPCGDGCQKCNTDDGCTACDFFYSALPHGAGCAFSWLRIFLLPVSLIVLVLLLNFCCCADFGYDDDHVRWDASNSVCHARMHPPHSARVRHACWHTRTRTCTAGRIRG